MAPNAPNTTWLQQVRIILVNPSHPGNIGSVARAMKTMGLSQLCLVAPERFPDARATWMASNADDVLASAQVVPTLEEAIGDCHLVVGASARPRSVAWPMWCPRETALETQKAIARTERVAILFGREDSGLTNEELALCHRHLHIPANPEYSALNLAAAVQVLCYELRMAALGEQPIDIQSDDTPAEQAEIAGFIEHFREVLVQVKFLDPDNPRRVIPRLQRLFSRTGMSKEEVKILRGFFRAISKTRALDPT